MFRSNEMWLKGIVAIVPWSLSENCEDRRVGANQMDVGLVY